MKYIGLDIGGTKCAMSVGSADNSVVIDYKEKFATADKSPDEILKVFSDFIARQMQKNEIGGIGISCGGPLDSRRGVIMKPPSLPLWDNVHIVDYFKDKFDVPVFLQNDANAGAVAEWKFGAGKGYNNLMFITFGTGFGAGLILNGKLYVGANDNAGEIGHVRLTETGPLGYFKEGSAEGYCSGGGIKRLADIMLNEQFEKGIKPKIFLDKGFDFDAKILADYARDGDEFSKSVYDKSGEMLGRILSVAVDIINPELIVIGGVFMRSNDLLVPKMEKVLKREALPFSYSACRIVTAQLSENIGDVSALVIARGDF